MVNGIRCTIVGVASPGFTGTFAFSESELYLPVNWRSGSGFDDRTTRSLHALARLRPGVTIAIAQSVMNASAARLARQFPNSNADLRVRVLAERLAPSRAFIRPLTACPSFPLWTELVSRQIHGDSECTAFDEGAVHSRTPILLKFLVRLPSTTATGRWRERARIGPRPTW